MVFISILVNVGATEVELLDELLEVLLDETLEELLEVVVELLIVEIISEVLLVNAELVSLLVVGLLDFLFSQPTVIPMTTAPRSNVLMNELFILRSSLSCGRTYTIVFAFCDKNNKNTQISLKKPITRIGNFRFSISIPNILEYRF